MAGPVACPTQLRLAHLRHRQTEIEQSPHSAEPVIAARGEDRHLAAARRANHLTTSRAQWATVFAASSIAATVTSGCAIMLGWSPPGTW
jgi:hypothetical protein